MVFFFVSVFSTRPLVSLCFVHILCLPQNCFSENCICVLRTHWAVKFLSAFIHIDPLKLSACWSVHRHTDRPNDQCRHTDIARICVRVLLTIIYYCLSLHYLYRSISATYTDTQTHTHRVFEGTGKRWKILTYQCCTELRWQPSIIRWLPTRCK